MGSGFEIIEHTADIGIVACGADAGEAFTSAARGLMSLIAEPECIMGNLSREIRVTAPDMESLLIAWLNELIYLFDTEHLLFKDFEVITGGSTHFKVRATGEKVDTKRHVIQREVKAATYHMLEVKEADSGWRVRVIFDI